KNRGLFVWTKWLIVIK
ncbi:hypothetical protein CDAR_367311, partial [Caerostris darwini]